MSALELEHILFRLHSRVTRASSGSPRLRAVVEFMLVAGSLLSFGVFVWLHTHYVGPSFANECLAKSIEGAISSAGGLEHVDLLRVRVTSERTTAFDALKSAVELKLLDLNMLIGSDKNVEKDASLFAGQVISLECAAGTASCYSHAPFTHSGHAPQAQLNQIADRVAGYLVTRQHGKPTSVPAEELVAWTAAQIELGSDEAATELALAAASAMMTGDLNIGFSREGDRVGDRIAARRSELTQAWSDAVTSGDILSPYQALISALVSETFSSRIARMRRTRNDTSWPVRGTGALFAMWDGLLAGIEGAKAAGLAAMELSGLVPKREAQAPDAGAGVGGRNETLHLRLRSAPFWRVESEAYSLVRPLLRRERGGASSDRELLARLLLGAAQAEAGPVLQAEASYTFTTDKSLLALDGRRRDQLSLRRVELDIPSACECMGDPFSRWLLGSVTGYDVPLLNAFASAVVRGRSGAGTSDPAPTLSPHPPSLGWVSVDSREEVHALSEAAEMAARVSLSRSGMLAFAMLKLGTLCSAVFLLFATSSLVSFILAQTQQRMLRFTVSLQSHVRARLPLAPLLAGHMVDSLIFVPIMLGVLFFMFSFFTDQLLAFLVMLAVWVCEVENIIGCRTEASMRVFPRVFGLLMTWFHAYYLAFPFGFAYPAFFVTCIGLITSGYDLWNRYELPALLDGSISLRTPRAPAVMGVMVMPWAGVAAATQLGYVPHVEEGVDEGEAAGDAEAGTHVGEVPGGRAPPRAHSSSSRTASTATSTSGARSTSSSNVDSAGVGDSAGVQGAGATARRAPVHTSPVLSPGLSPAGLPPVSPSRGGQTMGLGLLGASSPFTASYRPPSHTETDLAGLLAHVPEPAIGVGIAAAAEAEAAAKVAAEAVRADADVETVKLPLGTFLADVVVSSVRRASVELALASRQSS